MYPQTHVYFAERVLGKKSDVITLGSVMPDMIIGGDIGHYEAHCKGLEIYRLPSIDPSLQDLDRAVSTHGFKPKGLDYYGDEKYQDFERGYCFEKARSITERTVDACNIPSEMGWWKAHNIIEMGVETIISARDYYNSRLESAMENKVLIKNVDHMLRQLCGKRSIDFISRVERFSGFIGKERATAESLANKFHRLMRMRHNVDIDLEKVMVLISDAADLVSADLDDFFDVASELVRVNIETMGDK